MHDDAGHHSWHHQLSLTGQNSKAPAKFPSRSGFVDLICSLRTLILGWRPSLLAGAITSLCYPR